MKALRKIHKLNIKLIASLLVFIFFFPKGFVIDLKAYSQYIDQYSGKTISVIGDSISSYDPSVYSNSIYDAYCYSNRSGATNPDGDASGVYNIDASGMWWSVVASGASMNINTIAAWWGSTLVNPSASGIGNSGNSSERIGAVSGSDVIMVLIGTNDANYGVDVSNFQTQYTEMLNSLKTTNPDSKIIALTLIAEGDDGGTANMAKYNSAIIAAANAAGVDYIDLASCGITADSMKTGGKYEGNEQIHPNADGQNLMGQYILNNLPAWDDDEPDPNLDTQVPSTPSTPTTPTGSNPTAVSGPMTEEVIDMDALGKFKMPGNPESITYNGKVNPITRLFDGLVNILDYIMGILFGAIKAVFVGWAEILETIFDGILHSIEEA